MNASEYSPLALRTAGTMSTEPSLLNAALGIAGEAAEILAVAIHFETNAAGEGGNREMLKELGDWVWYANLACHALGSSLEAQMPIINCPNYSSAVFVACDLVVVSGHFADSIKKLAFHQKAADIPKLLTNVRDGLFHIDGMLSWAGFTWEQLFEANIAKLAARYPAGTFDPVRANNRDDAAEQAAVNKVL